VTYWTTWAGGNLTLIYSNFGEGKQKWKVVVSKKVSLFIKRFLNE